MFFRKQHIKKPDFVWKSLPDEDLIKIYAQTNDLEYVTELFERYTHLIFTVCMKYLKNEENSKDAVMSIFEELVEKIKHHDIINFKNWLYSLTKNHCLMKLRKVKQFENFAATDLQHQKEVFMETMQQLHPLNEVDDKENLILLKDALKTLNKEQELCVTLFYLEEKSYKEVEELTGFSSKQVKSHIQNGKRNLKLYLEKNGKK